MTYKKDKEKKLESNKSSHSPQISKISSILAQYSKQQIIEEIKES